MTFKCYTLLLDQVCPSLGDFKSLGKVAKSRFFLNDYLYEFSMEIVDERFVLISVDYDDQRYRSKVYNIVTEHEDDNPKQRTQIELKQQFFACYDTQKCELFISDPAKKGSLRAYLSENWMNEVRIRARIASAKDFDETVRYIRKVTFTQTLNLVNAHPDSIFAQRYNPLGLDVPDRLKTTLEYQQRLDAIPLRSQIKELFDKHKTREIESIEIIGEDEEGFEQRFNLDNIIKEITITLDTDEDKRYDRDSVFQLLLLRLRG